jgi:hypothetical protein
VSDPDGQREPGPQGPSTIPAAGDPQLQLAVELTHCASVESLVDEPGLMWWSATLTARGREARDPDTTGVAVVTASLLVVDSPACEDPGLDLDNISVELGRLAFAYGEDLNSDGTGGWSSFVGRVLFVEDLTVQPHWRGRRLAPATILVAATALGNALQVVVEPAAVSWQPDGGEAEGGGWQDFGFTALGGSDDFAGIYSFATSWCSFPAEEIAVAQEMLSSLQFTAEDIAWWREARRSSAAS